MKIRRIGLFSLTAALFLGLFAFPTTANAAAVSCNGTGSYHSLVYGKGHIYVNMPSYNDWGGGGGYNCYLAPGASNTAVKELQFSLNICYGQRLVLDGVYGASTKAALLAAQKSIKAATYPSLVADGLYGPATAGSMRFLDSTEKCSRVGEGR